MRNFIKAISLIVIVVLSLSTKAQVGIGTTSPDNSSILDLTSTSAGLLIPRMTNTEMNNITTPATGLIVYNTTNSCIYFYNGAIWVSTCASSSNFWATAGNSSLTINQFLGSTDATDLNFRTDNTLRMVLSSGGNLGIGVASPSNALTVAGTLPLRILGTTHDAAIDTVLVINSSGVVYKRSVSSFSSNFWSLTGNNSLTINNFIGSTDATNLNFRTNDSLRMVLSSSGYLGVGMASPTNTLTVAGTLPLRVLGLTHDVSIDTIMVIDPSGVVYKRAFSTINITDWKLTGNSGTNASTNFIGTTDAVDFAFRVNNAEVGRFKTTTRSFVGGNNSVLTGTNSFVFGTTDTVGASYSAVFGNNNKPETNADYSLVAGGDNIIKSTASYSVTTGELNVNEGVHASGHGEHLFVNSYNMFAVGSYNDTVTGNRTFVDSTNHLFVVGNGHKFCDRSNVITATWGGNVGIDNKDPQTALDVHGGFSLRPRTTLTQGTTASVSSNNFPYIVENRSYLRIDSDGSPATRSIVLSDGLQTGQIIVIECIAAGGVNGVRIIDNTGTHNINSNGTRDLYINDMIGLMWNGDDWIEIFYTNN